MAWGGQDSLIGRRLAVEKRVLVVDNPYKCCSMCVLCVCAGHIRLLIDHCHLVLFHFFVFVILQELRLKEPSAMFYIAVVTWAIIR